MNILICIIVQVGSSYAHAHIHIHNYIDNYEYSSIQIVFLLIFVSSEKFYDEMTILGFNKLIA